MAHCQDVNIAHQAKKLLGAGFAAFLEELEAELVLEVGERVVDVIVPSLHEPLGPHVVGLKALKVPVKHFTDPHLCFVYLLRRDRVISAVAKAIDMRRVDLLQFGRDMQASDAYHLKFRHF